MFNYSDVEAHGRERLNGMQREARHHDLAERAHRHARQSEKDRSRLMRVLSFIRIAPVRWHGTGIKPETTCQNFWQTHDTVRTR